MMKMKMKSVALQSGVNRESQFRFLSLSVLAQRSKNQKRVHTLLSLSLSRQKETTTEEREKERERLLREKREERRKEFLLSFVSFFLKDEMFEKKKNTDGLCGDRGQKWKIWRKKKLFFSLITRNATQRENHFKVLLHTLRYLLPSSLTRKNETDREKEEKRRRRSIRSRIQRRAEVNDPILQIDGVDFNPVESVGAFRPKETVTKRLSWWWCCGFCRWWCVLFIREEQEEERWRKKQSL